MCIRDREIPILRRAGSMDDCRVAKVAAGRQPPSVSSHVLDREPAGWLEGDTPPPCQRHPVDDLAAAAEARGEQDLFSIRRPGEPARAPVAFGENRFLPGEVHDVPGAPVVPLPGMLEVREK